MVQDTFNITRSMALISLDPTKTRLSFAGSANRSTSCRPLQRVREGTGDGGGTAGDVQPLVDVSRWVRTDPSEMPRRRTICMLVRPAARSFEVATITGDCQGQRRRASWCS